jgi:hypothetical protein
MNPALEWVIGGQAELFALCCDSCGNGGLVK